MNELRRIVDGPRLWIFHEQHTQPELKEIIKKQLVVILTS